MKQKKGQYFSFDAITAAVIFIITMSIILTYWFNITGMMYDTYNEDYKTAIRISDVLISKGNPAWDAEGHDTWVRELDGDTDNIITPGFAYDSNLPILKEDIIGHLDEWVKRSSTGNLEVGRYENLKTVLRTQGYEVNIKVFKEGMFGGTGASPSYNIGMDNYTNTNKSVASYNRIIVLNDTDGNLIRGNLQVNVW